MDTPHAVMSNRAFCFAVMICSLEVKHIVIESEEIGNLLVNATIKISDSTVVFVFVCSNVMLDGLEILDILKSNLTLSADSLCLA